jgi:mannose-6-phosphate isomerase-like protein (cupin superfamily)
MDSPANGRGWRLADAATVPALWNVGHDGVPIDEDEAYERIAERDPGIVERWEAIERRHPGYDEQVEYHSVRQHFGIRAFGVAAWTAPAGQCLIPPHSETDAAYDNEELYVLLSGAARILCDGTEIAMAPGQLLFVEPQVFREGVALETPTTILVIGGVPGKAYTPPPFALDWADAPPPDVERSP